MPRSVTNCTVCNAVIDITYTKEQPLPVLDLCKIHRPKKRVVVQ